MNIYFSCSITGGRQDESAYQQIVEFLEAGGHEVPTAILARPEAMMDEAVVEPTAVYQRDVAWVEGCDAVVAEVSTPSHGVGYEIALALLLGKPVLCCHQRERRVSKMITGNTHPGMRLAVYDTPQEMIAAVSAFLDEVQRKAN